MESFKIIQAEWNIYNGFIFELFYFEVSKGENSYQERSLLGFFFSDKFLYIKLLFLFEIKVFDKTK